VATLAQMLMTIAGINTAGALRPRPRQRLPLPNRSIRSARRRRGKRTGIPQIPRCAPRGCIQ